MSEQPGRVEVTVRCSRCRTAALARLLPRPVPLRWRVDRIERVPWDRQPARVGIAKVGDPSFGVADDDGTLPSPRMLPVEIPADTYRTSFSCRRCKNPSTAKLRELRARADQANAAGWSSTGRSRYYMSPSPSRPP